MQALRIMDTTLRDAHQSLWATRMEISDMLPILDKTDKVGYWALEVWGGATFDTCLRFLDENPWDRLRTIKKHCPNTPLQMLTRGQNLVGYHHYSKDIVNRFIKASHKNGVDIFRVFDALNDVRNVIDSAEALNECGAWFEGAISYTLSPVHTLDSYVEYAQQLKELGAKSISIKDMAGLLTPFRCERLVKVLNKEVGLPIHVHCHYVGGMAPANYIKAAEAGAAIVDTATAPLAFGNSQPAVEMIVAALKESSYDTGLDLDLLFEIADYWEGVRKKRKFKRGISTLSQMHVYSHQVPGGMMSNLISQLSIQKAEERLQEVLEEIPKVRAEVGYPPLVTPMSQIVGTQSVFNVLTGKRWSVISKEMKDYIAGYYGKTPGKIDPKIQKLVLGDDSPLPPDVAPSSLVTTSYEQLEEELGELATCEEDVLMYAMFPNEGKAFLEKKHRIEHTNFLMNESVEITKEDEEMDTAQIRELVKMVEETGIGEISVLESGAQVIIRSASMPVVATTPVPAGMQAPSIGSAADVAAENVAAGIGGSGAGALAGGAKAGAKGADDVDRPDTWIPVVAPMVGTFYVAPSPDSDPFVQVGDKVAAGDTLCIVEAMKLMNEISAEELAYVREVCLNDADPVEYGTVMFYIEPISE